MDEQLPDREALERSSRKFTWLAGISFLLLAFFSALSSFFVWVLGGCGVYFGFLAVYNRILAGRLDQPFQFAQKSEASTETQAYVRKHLPRVIMLLTAGFAVAIALLTIIRSGGSDATEGNGELNTDTEIRADAGEPDADALLESGNQFYNSNEFDSALAYYDRALALQPGFREALYNKALVYSSRQDYSTAVVTLEKCLAGNPNYGEAIQLVAYCYYMQNQHDQALNYYQRAYDTGLRNAELSHYLGYLYDEKNNFSRAVQFYLEAVGQDSSKVDVYKRLAELDVEHADLYLRKVQEWGGNR